MKNKILVLGYFGYVTNQLDGQTVKTRDMFRLLREQKGAENVDFYDTQLFKFKRLSLFNMFHRVIRCKTLIYLPAHNNLKYIFPIVFLLSQVCRFKIHYFVIGGWLSEFIKTLPVHQKMLKHIKGIHVETKRLKNDLEQIYGYKNVDIFPNFRFFDFKPIRTESFKLRLVFMARINKMKGLDWIFNLANYISDNKISDKVSITFYGPVFQEDSEYFHSSIAKYDFVSYKGILHPEAIYRTLSQYDIMLLPTHYYTEGLPGSVVDAYISGIPVIATEWKHAREFINDGVNGFIIPFKNGQDALIEKVMYLMRNPQDLVQMQMNALHKRQDFTPHTHTYTSDCLRLIYISRICEDKGLDTLKKLYDRVRSTNSSISFSIDFFGQMTDDYFYNHLSDIPNYCYKGVLQPEEVIPTLEKYDALIFPSHYEGEGCPGIMVEALFAGLPIIASDWKYNSEIVDNGVNGILCDTYNAADYEKAIRILSGNPKLISKMSEASLRKASNYTSESTAILLRNILNHYKECL